MAGDIRRSYRGEMQGEGRGLTSFATADDLARSPGRQGRTCAGTPSPTQNRRFATVGAE